MARCTKNASPRKNQRGKRLRDTVLHEALAEAAQRGGDTMEVWLIRAGGHGEYEQKSIQESRVYVTWDGLDVDLSKLDERSDLVEVMTKQYPETKPKVQ